MKSPFFWKNLCLVLVLAANFAFIVWLITRKPAPVSPPMNVSWQIVLRSLSVMYATLSCLLLIFAVVQFGDAEFTPRSQACWKRRNDWKRIQPGMTKKQVIDILGPAFNPCIWNELDRNDYSLHALDWGNNSIVYYSIVPENGTEEAKVVEKYPSDEDMLDIDSFWWPNFQTRSYLLLKDHLVRTSLAVSFIGILLLAIISSIPVWLCTDWRSLSLYIPAAAAVLCIANENCQTGGWRCDAIFLIPAYAVIVVAWLFRVIHVAQK